MGKWWIFTLKPSSGLWNYGFNNKNMWLPWDWHIWLGLQCLLHDDDLNMFEKWGYFEIHKIVTAHQGI